jgi:galactokinase
MTISDLFREQFGAKPAACARAPGRVNLIGEHIDYNGGHVMPMAINRGIEIAARPRADGRFRLVSSQQRKVYDGALPAARESAWSDYVFGVVHEFHKLGVEVPGMDVVVDGSIPRGSGLSSSAALEVVAAWVIQALSGSRLSRQEIALLCQRAENQFVGVNCGIMDQTASACARAGHALLLSCDTLASEHIPLESGGRAAILVAHSGVRRGLSASAYNERRTQCEEALRVVREKTGKALPCLCAASLDDLAAASGALAPEIHRRARHAITEEQRVRGAALALRRGDLEEMGRLLDASHESLRDDYEVSCPELDDLVRFIRGCEGTYGSRLTGAGFGGCAVSLVAAESAKKTVEELENRYYRLRNATPIAFVTEACDGAALLDA